MLITDLQAVLNVIVDNYSEISPQILRSAVEYAKFQASNPSLDTDDETGGKTPLLIRSEGYIEGYSHMFDEYYNSDAIDIATSEYTEDVMLSIREDYGEDAPTAIISACADFANVIASKRHADSTYADVVDVVRLSALGYMDGALAADADIEFGKRIRSMNPSYDMGTAEVAFDIVADEIHLQTSIDSTVTLKTAATAGLCDMMDMLVYPKSGNGEIATEDPLICAMLYILGYLKGIGNSVGDQARAVDHTDDLNDIEHEGSELEKEQKPDNVKTRQCLIDESLVAMWCRYSGYPDRIFEEACASMQKEIRPATSEDVPEDDSGLAMLYGVGYADGAWMSSRDDDVTEQELQEMEISEEIDKIFANMDIDEV